MIIDTDLGLIDVVTGYQPAAVITTAVRIGVFEALGVSEQDPGDLATELGADPANLEALLEGLRSLGLVVRTSAGYAASDFACRRLGPGGELASVVLKEATFADAWTDLDQVIIKGRPTMTPWKDLLRTRPEQARDFLDALDVLARIGGPPMEQIEAFAAGRRVLDVGGGLGTYSRLLDDLGCRVTLVDFPQVAAWAREKLGDTAVSVIGVDLFDHPSCGVGADSTDVALVSHLLHDLPRSQAINLLRRVRNALVRGGQVVINDFSTDSGPGSFGPMFDLMMRVETGGAAHSRSALIDMAGEAGFARPELLDLDDPLTVIVGTKA